MSRARDRRKRLAIATWFTKHRATAIQRDVCLEFLSDGPTAAWKQFQETSNRFETHIIHIFLADSTPR